MAMLGKWASSLILHDEGVIQIAAVEAGSAAAYIRSIIDRISTTKLDLVGLISALSTDSAKKSFTFSSLSDSLNITGHVGPGSLSLATAFIRMSGFRMAQLLTLGDVAALPDMECPPGIRYLGIYSHTDCPVLNTVGASIIGEHKGLWNLPEGMPLGRETGRRVEVLVLSAAQMPRTKSQSGEYIPIRAQLKGSTLDAFFLGALPLLLTAGLIILACITKEWFAAGLIAVGTIGMGLAVSALQWVLMFKYDKVDVSEGAPERGDCLISDNNTFHIVQGSEKMIQTLFQRSLHQEVKMHGRLALLLSGLMLYAYSLASIIWLPNISVYGQMFFTGANLVGLFFDMIKGTKNGRLGLARKAREQFNVELKERVVFRNRTAAVAFLARYMEDREKLKPLLPADGLVWGKWWEVFLLKAHDDGHAEYEIQSAKFTTPKEHTLFNDLIGDMNTGLTCKADIEEAAAASCIPCF